MNDLILGDCLKEMKKLPDNSVDVIITDPPYNISVEGKDIIRKTLSSKFHKRNSNIKQDFGEWDKKPELEYKKFTEEWFKECSRILKPSGWIFVFFSKQEGTGALVFMSGIFLMAATISIGVLASPFAFACLLILGGLAIFALN